MVVNGSSESWLNHFIMGAAHLVKCRHVRGFYMDGIAFNRNGMKRMRRASEEAMRKAMRDQNRLLPFCEDDDDDPRCFPHFDNHPNNKTVVYLEHLPFFDSIWPGEMSDYNISPEHHFVHLSGIPFGVPGQMLSGKLRNKKKTNKLLYYRGLLFGMTDRLGWNHNSGDLLESLWRLWDDFGMEHTAISGFWSRPEERVVVDVQGNSRVRATSFTRRDTRTSLIVIASWDPQPGLVTLVINWAHLRRVSTATIPAITGLQRSGSLQVQSSGVVEVDLRSWDGGLLLIL